MQAKNPLTGLTKKQEAFCEAFVRLGDKSAAYRESYSCSRMKSETINNKAYALSEKGDIRARIEELQKKASIIAYLEFEHTINDSLRMDFELIDKYKKHIAILENEKSTDKQIAVAKRTIQFIGINGFNAAMERISRKCGFYKKDNDQSKPEIHVNWNEEKTYEEQKNKK